MALLRISVVAIFFVRVEVSSCCCETELFKFNNGDAIWKSKAS